MTNDEINDLKENMQESSKKAAETITNTVNTTITPTLNAVGLSVSTDGLNEYLGADLPLYSYGDRVRDPKIGFAKDDPVIGAKVSIGGAYVNAGAGLGIGTSRVETGVSLGNNDRHAEAFIQREDGQTGFGARYTAPHGSAQIVNTPEKVKLRAELHNDSASLESRVAYDKDDTSYTAAFRARYHISENGSIYAQGSGIVGSEERPDAAKIEAGLQVPITGRINANVGVTTSLEEGQKATVAPTAGITISLRNKRSR